MERAPYTHQTHMRAPALIHWSKAGRRSKREGEGRKIQPLSPSPSIPTLFFLLLLLLLLFDLFRPWGKGRGTSRICHALKTRADSSCETRSHTATREPTAHFKAHSENRGAFQRMMMKKKKHSFSHLGHDQVGRVLDGRQALRAVLVQGDLELLLQGHHDFHGVQGVGAQVRELGLGADLNREKLVCVSALLVRNDARGRVRVGYFASRSLLLSASHRRGGAC